MLDQGNNFYLISLSNFSLPVYWIMYGCYREKLHVNHFGEVKGSVIFLLFIFNRFREISNKPLQECMHASDSMANKP